MAKPEKKEKPQGIDRFIGMTWKRAQRELQENAHLLVLTDKPDDRAHEVATTLRDTGLLAGLAALVAHLYVKKYGGASAALVAVGMYREIAWSLMSSRSKGKTRKQAETLQHELGNLEGWLYYAQGAHIPSDPKKIEWPLKHEFRKRHEKAGLANIMMFLAAKDLGDSGTGNLIAASHIVRFLDRGFKKKQD